jgi:hypothetical protein
MDNSREVESRLIAYWRGQPELRLRPGASDEQVRQFEHRYRIVLSTGLRRIYQQVDGFDQHSHSMDINGFNFYPLTHLRRLDQYEDRFDVADPSSFFLFCDYLTWSWGYAVRIGEAGTSTSVVLLGVDGSGVRNVTTTIWQFWELYIRDDPRLYI